MFEGGGVCVSVVFEGGGVCVSVLCLRVVAAVAVVCVSPGHRGDGSRPALVALAVAGLHRGLERTDIPELDRAVAAACTIKEMIM